MSSHLEENMSVYLAGGLNAAEKQAADVHLNQCAQCRKELDALRALDTMLSHSGSLEPSAGFVRGVMKRLDQDRKVIAFRSGRAVAWVALAAVIAFFVFVIGYRQSHPSAGMARQPKAQHAKEEVAKQQPPPPSVTPQPAPVQSVQEATQVSPEDAELIANLDLVEDLDVIENYDNLENLDVAILESSEEKVQ